MSEVKTLKDLKMADVRIDGETQARVGLHDQTVSDYTEALKTGDEFPPLDVFYDGVHYWLADGFHRYFASQHAGKVRIRCEIHKGDKRAAKLYAASANKAHGLRRTNADKRKAVMMILSDCEWKLQSDNWIAKQCGVSNDLVATMRKESTLGTESEDRYYDQEPVRKTADGRTMNTANIGRKKQSEKADDTDHTDTAFPENPQIDAPPEVDGYGRPAQKFVEETHEIINPHLPDETPEPVTTLKDLTQAEEDALSPEEWLAMLPLFDKLVLEKINSRLFCEAALNWRNMRKFYLTLRREVKANVNGAAPDAYSVRMRAAVSIPHPKDWTFSRGAAGGFIL